MANDVFSGKLKKTGVHKYDDDGDYVLVGSRSSIQEGIECDKGLVERYESKLEQLKRLSKPTEQDQRKIDWYEEHINLVRERIEREESYLKTR